MKKFIILFALVLIGFAGLAQEQEPEKVSFLASLDWGSILNYVLGFVAVVAAGFVTKFKSKVASFADLLSAFSEAIEDNKIDANERTDLVEKAKALLSK